MAARATGLTGMLRSFFILLVLANLLFFAWGQGYFGGAEEGREPQRLAKQLSPEKLRVVGALAPSAALPVEICRLVGGLSLGEAQRLRTQAGEKAPSLQLAVNLVDEEASYWVLVPSLPDRPAAEKRVLELKRMGLADATLVQEEGPGKFAISLGLFKSARAANEYLQVLAKRGVKSAKVQAREKSAVPAQLVVRGPSDLLAKQLPELLSIFPAASVADCPAERRP